MSGISSDGNPFDVKLPKAVVRHLIIIGVATVAGTISNSSLDPLMLWLASLGACWVINDVLKGLPKLFVIGNQIRLDVYYMAFPMTLSPSLGESTESRADWFGTSADHLASSVTPTSTGPVKSREQTLATFSGQFQPTGIMPDGFFLRDALSYIDLPANHRASPNSHDYVLPVGTILGQSTAEASVFAYSEEIGHASKTPDTNVQDITLPESGLSHSHDTPAADFLSGPTAAVVTGNALGPDAQDNFALVISTEVVNSPSCELAALPTLGLLSRLNSLDLDNFPVESRKQCGSSHIQIATQPQLPVAQISPRTSSTSNLPDNSSGASVRLDALLQAVGSLLSLSSGEFAQAQTVGDFNLEPLVDVLGNDMNILRSTGRRFLSLPASPSDDLLEVNIEVRGLPMSQDVSLILPQDVEIVTTNISTQPVTGATANPADNTVTQPNELLSVHAQDAETSNLSGFTPRPDMAVNSKHKIRSSGSKLLKSFKNYLRLQRK